MPAAPNCFLVAGMLFLCFCCYCCCCCCWLLLFLGVVFWGVGGGGGFTASYSWFISRVCRPVFIIDF